MFSNQVRFMIARKVAEHRREAVQKIGLSPDARRDKARSPRHFPAPDKGIPEVRLDALLAEHQRRQRPPVKWVQIVPAIRHRTARSSTREPGTDTPQNWIAADRPTRSTKS
jgi:hypothetical protein